VSCSERQRSVLASVTVMQAILGPLACGWWRSSRLCDADLTACAARCRDAGPVALRAVRRARGSWPDPDHGRELIRSGLRLEPTGRNLRHYTVGFDDLGQGVKILNDCRHQVRTNPYYHGQPYQQGGAMEPEIDLVADLNSEDDDGLGWSSLSDARDAAQVGPG
jgi:hypothetical protein